MSISVHEILEINMKELKNTKGQFNISQTDITKQLITNYLSKLFLIQNVKEEVNFNQNITQLMTNIT